MTLFSKGRVVKKYKISLGRNSKGPKVKAGDAKTPEGIYVIDSRNPAAAIIYRYTSPIQTSPILSEPNNSAYLPAETS
jgi:hypothetical protein